MIKIKIMRHAERLDFTNPLYWLVCIGQYWADSPLTTNGHTTAYDKGKIIACDNFNPKIIYTSPYKRTMQTSTEIQKSLSKAQIITEPLLSEYQPTFCHKISLYPDGLPTTYNGSPTEFNYPESHENFTKRIRFIIDKIIDNNNNDVMLVTHGEVVKACANYFQTIYPDLILDPGNTPYLTTLTFIYDKNKKKIIKESIKID